MSSKWSPCFFTTAAKSCSAIGKLKQNCARTKSSAPKRSQTRFYRPMTNGTGARVSLSITYPCALLRATTSCSALSEAGGSSPFLRFLAGRRLLHLKFGRCWRCLLTVKERKDDHQKDQDVKHCVGVEGLQQFLMILEPGVANSIKVIWVTHNDHSLPILLVFPKRSFVSLNPISLALWNRNLIFKIC